jgi:hypothetical protein
VEESRIEKTRSMAKIVSFAKRKRMRAAKRLAK